MSAPANLAARLSAHASASPDAEALIWRAGGERCAWTFREIEAHAARSAERLAARGVSKGERVLAVQPMAPALYVALIALFRLGAVAVFPDPQSLRRTILSAVELLEPRAMIGPFAAQFLRMATPSLWKLASFHTSGVAPFSTLLLAEGGPSHDLSNVAPEAPALATFTSGSTGAPKALVRSHALLGAQQDAVAAGLGLAPGQRWLSTLPVFPLSILAAGATALLPAVDVRKPAEVDAEGLIDQIAAEEVTGLIASPSLGERLALQARENDSRLASLQQVFLGGGPVFPDIAAAWSKAAPHTACHVAYGSSEAEPIAHRRAQGADEEASSIAAQGGGLLVGPPTDETRLRVIRDHWGAPLAAMSGAELDALKAADGEPGEIIVAGAHVLPGYFNGAGDDETRIRVDGEAWFRTGDAGVIDGQGRVRLLGRCAERINIGARAAYPLQIEAIIRAEAPHARTAALQMDEGVVCLVEKIGVREANAMLEQLSDYGVTCVLSPDRVPMDRRHGSKVDYPRARALARKILLKRAESDGRNAPDA